MLKKAIDVDSENADAYYKLSEIYAMSKIYRPAYENLDRAIYYFKKQGRIDDANRIENILTSFAQNPESFNQAIP